MADGVEGGQLSPDLQWREEKMKRREEIPDDLLGVLEREMLELPDFYKIVEDVLKSDVPDEEKMRAIQDTFNTKMIFSNQLYHHLQSGFGFDKQFKHDLNNLTTGLFLALGILGGTYEINKNNPNFNFQNYKAYLGVIRQTFPCYVAVLEDAIGRRKIENGGSDIERYYHSHQRPLNLEILESTVGTLALVNTKYRQDVEKKLHSKLSFSTLLKDDEEVLTVPGSITTVLAEKIRNAARAEGKQEGYVSNHVVLGSGREEDGESAWLVLYVADDDGGMPKETIDEGDTRNSMYYRESQSGRGHGERYSPDRISLSNGVITVYSRSKSGDKKWHSSREGQADGIENLSEEGRQEALSDIDAILRENSEYFSADSIATITKIRIPITKKAKNS